MHTAASAISILISENQMLPFFYFVFSEKKFSKNCIPGFQKFSLTKNKILICASPEAHPPSTFWNTVNLIRVLKSPVSSN